MSKSYCKVIIVGNVGKDPEVKTIGTGTSVANFSVAVEESYKDKSGSWQKKTEWINIVAWQKLAEIVQQYVKKGSKIFIEGRLETQSWQDKTTDKKVYKTVVVANELLLLDKPSAKQTENSPAVVDDSDIPF